MSKKSECNAAKYSDSISKFDNLTDQVRAMMEAAGIAPAGDVSSAGSDPLTLNIKHLHIHVGERNRNTYMTVSGDCINGNHTCENHMCGLPFDDFELSNDEGTEDDGKDINLEEMIAFIHEKTGFRITDITEMMQAQLAFLKSIYGNEPCGCDDSSADGREV